MSSAVISTSAAPGRPFVFDDEAGTSAQPKAPESVLSSLQATILSSVAGHRKSAIRDSAAVAPASQLTIRPAPERVPIGIRALDALTGGLPRGCITEICGPALSGRTSILLAALAAATRRGEFCAVVDASDALDPHSVVAAGVNLNCLLWVRCGEDLTAKNLSSRRHGGEKHFRSARTNSNADQRRIEQVLRASDLLLESRGFGLIVLDLADLPPQEARRIPLTTWFRFRRAIEYKPTILLAIEQQPIAGSCSSLLLQLEPTCPRETMHGEKSCASETRESVAQRGIPEENAACRVTDFDAGHRRYPHQNMPGHARLFTGLQITAKLTYSRLERKPAQSATFAAKTAWAG